MVLGAQLYTVREYIQNEKDMAYTLEKIAAMGYTTVQVSGVGSIPPEKIRELCDRNNLKIVLTHVDPSRIIGDTAQIIKEHDILGCDYIGIGSMPDKYRSAEWIHRFVADFKEPARKIAAAGKLLMYHNHHFEFERLGTGVHTMYHYLMESFTKEELGFTLDTYWVQAGGGDICDWIEVLRDRIPCIHLKDMAVCGGQQVMAAVMEGNINFQKILSLLEKTGQTKYLLVEQDICPEGAFACLEKSYNNLSGLGYR